MLGWAVPDDVPYTAEVACTLDLGLVAQDEEEDQATDDDDDSTHISASAAVLELTFVNTVLFLSLTYTY